MGNEAVRFHKVVIIGVGLIGGSLGMAGLKRGFFGEVIGVGRHRSNLEKAVERGAVSRYLHDPIEACKGADLVVLATPVDRILSIGKEIVSSLTPGVCVTDVGSVKKALTHGLDQVMPEGTHFVGAHPIAGSEASGAAAARIDLFEGAKTILTPTARTDPKALKKVRSLWEGVGSKVLEMDADAHDRLLAAVSHLPHMAAYALVNTLADMEREEGDVSSFAAGGFRDITRIASSHPEMWVEICRMNKQEIVYMIEKFECALRAIKADIKEGRFEALSRNFEKARTFRDGL